MTAQHILVPTDFSDPATDVLDYAIQLAKALEARLTVLHGLYLSYLPLDEVNPAVIDSTYEAMETTAQNQMQRELERVQQAGVEGESAIVEGIPFQVIMDTAKSRGIDLIVMGTHGRTGYAHLLLGSVAEKVVRLAPCPVLVTRGIHDVSAA